jgi:PKD repeat protein
MSCVVGTETLQEGQTYCDANKNLFKCTNGVLVFVSSGCGSTTTPAPLPVTMINTPSSFSGLTVTITTYLTNCTSSTLTWGDGGSTSSLGNGSLYTHTYGSGGTKTITLIGYNADGKSYTDSKSVSVTAPSPDPVTMINVSGSSGLTASISTYLTNCVRSTLSWGDGTTSSSSSNGYLYSHTYSSGGTKTITLTGYNAEGKSYTDTKSISVSAPVLLPATMINVSSSSSGLIVNITAYLTNCSSATLSWGDGNTTSNLANGTSYSHTYGASGSKTISLTGYNSAGQSYTDTKTVTTTSPVLMPVTMINVLSVDGLTAHIETYVSNCSSSTLSWGDGSTMEDVVDTLAYTHTYTASGTKSITLVGYNSEGKSYTDTKTVTVTSTAIGQCPDDTFYFDPSVAECIKKETPPLTCPTGFYPDPTTATCLPDEVPITECPTGFYLDPTTASCLPDEVVPARCPSSIYINKSGIEGQKECYQPAGEAGSEFVCSEYGTWELLGGSCGTTTPPDGGCNCGSTCLAGKCSITGQTCINGVCKQTTPPAECSSVLFCPSGKTCVGGVCKTTTVTPSCSSSLNCPSGQTCVGGVCKSNTVTPSCTSTLNCKSGETCVGGVCKSSTSGSKTSCVGMNRNGSLDPTCIIEKGNEIYLLGALGIVAAIVLLKR